MNIKKSPLFYCLLAFCLPLTLSANIIVDGTFDNAMTSQGVATFHGELADIGGDGNIYNDGWLAGSEWATSGGQAVRQTSTNFGIRAFAQMITNPLDGNFDNGDQVTISFDYVFDANSTASTGFGYKIWGVEAPSGTGATWNPFSNESINLSDNDDFSGISGDVTAGADYQFYELDFLEDSTGDPALVNYSNSITLTQDYELFAIAFYAEPNTGSHTINVDNVSFSAIPEPETYAMMLSVAVLGLAVYRRRKKSS